MDQMNQIKDLAGKYLEEVISIRRHLHRNPELSFNEKETSSYIRRLLDNWKIPYEFPFVGTGFVAAIRGGMSGGPVIALRSDMDALPINEDPGLEFTSENPGVMHACGHDVHMACLLGSMRILNDLRSQLKGTVLLIFQPGEEKLPGGAKLMMEEGIFKKINPDMIIAQHVLPEMEAGTVGFKPGPYMASSDEIYLTVKGNGGHGALPEHINDPVLMASHILIALQQEINRKSPKKIPTVLSFGKVTANGAVNVIPDQVELEGTFRTMNEEWRKEAHRLIRQISGGISSGMGGTVDVEIKNGYPVLVNDPDLTMNCRNLAAKLLGENKVVDMDIRMTAEDFAWYSHTYPSMMYRLGVKTPGREEIFPLHTSRFIADEAAIETGIKTMSWLAFSLLNK